ncbi:meiosis-specific with OB domain-containing protein isoform X2 [Silurus meridionalis]|uniref:meiosis-specific with OB domain-containing protein isoform X2 n=1 Tax=Silurus meridionalis TaxID=175797 RepID=UPI001EEC7196|nr:meiosis-specific with OB domain-containing protein isoform X2 [Silurus meridionalis]
MENGSTYSSVSISDLNPSITRPNLVGIIIGKTDARGFPDRKNVGSERFTFNFTIKDSPIHYINVSSWGTEQYIQGLCSHFKIGDCVFIENPLVVTKDPEKEDRFCPLTPSFYRLLVTETHSAIRMCSDLDTESRLLPLFHIPVKDSGDFYTLGDITANGQSLDGNFINILAAVRSIGEPKYFTTSDGRKGQKLEIKLFDETLTSFPFICWDRETIQFVQTLPPRETVLFIVDARINFDTFRNSMVATATSKTIITMNPGFLCLYIDTLEANQLFSYAKELSESEQLNEPEIEVNVNVPCKHKTCICFNCIGPSQVDSEYLFYNYFTVDSICDVQTVSQVKARALNNSDAFYVVIYGFITTLGLDSCITRVIRSRCDRCKFRVHEDTEVCTNAACPKQGEAGEVTAAFDLLVDISDHTGTLQSCNLSGTVAEQTLGCTSKEFVCLSESNRTAMKWKFLLERCKVYVKVLPSTKSKIGMRTSILSCTLADPVEVKQSMSAFTSFYIPDIRLNSGSV